MSDSSYNINDVVRIKSGQFADFVGRVEELNDEKSSIKVIATIFGRRTKIELNLSDIEKVKFTKE